VDIIGLVTSFNQDLNERRLERGLAMIEDSGAKPLVIVNKSDLVSAEVVTLRVAELSARLGVAVLPCSAQTLEGIADITAKFSAGQSVAFLGMSGVGKSTLINAILGKEVLLTREIRDDDSRGRHTTTHRELFLSEKGFWVIDNPGIREFSFSGDEESLDRAFDDVTTYMNCRFSDCSHTSEPGCGISAALQSGALSLARWENYQKIKREMEFQENKGNKAYQSEKRKEWAKRSTWVRQILKDKGKK
jgi:ribosome biogenesis GTPase